MKIPVSFPFNTYWKNAYLVMNNEPRRNVILFNNELDRTTISYARYLASCCLGYIISDEYVVDHIDGNPLNDTLTNYQLLTVQQNILKGIIERGNTQEYVQLECGVCKTIFDKPKNQTHLIKGNISTYCSRSCSGKAIYYPVSKVMRIYKIHHDLPEGLLFY